MTDNCYDTVVDQLLRELRTLTRVRRVVLRIDHERYFLPIDL
ncbi:hypothetical protein OKW34_003780 [Paraburkholderia youngii]